MEERSQLDDAAVEAIVLARTRMRRRHEYAAADAARISLLLNGVVVEDGPGGESVWVRLPDYGDTSPRKRILHLPKAGCMLWSHKKRSFCKNTREPHQYFCAFHIASRGDLTGKMPCPLDPRHSIRPAKAFAHVHICQSRPGVTAITKDPIASCSDMHCISEQEIRMRCSDVEYLRTLLAKVDAASKALNVSPTACSSLQRHAVASGSKKEKQKMQLEALAKQIIAMTTDTERSEFVAIEACCGRGRLSAAVAAELARETNNTGSAHFVMIDRATLRKKADVNISPGPRGSVQRLTQDLSKVTIESILDNDAISVPHGIPIILFGKHLCGSATDFGIRCLLAGAGRYSGRCRVAIAPCCHHLCSWSDIVGVGLLSSAPGCITAEDFAILRKCCTFYNASLPPESAQAKAPTERLALARIRKKLGIATKAVINAARAETLRQNMPSRFVAVEKFVDSDATPECYALIAK